MFFLCSPELFCSFITCLIFVRTFFPVAQLVKNLPAMWETWVWSLVGKITWRRERLPTPVFWPGEFHGLYIPWGNKELDKLSDFHSLLLVTVAAFRGFPGGTVESTCNVGDLDSVPGLGGSSGEGNGNTLQYFCLGNPTDRGA